MNWIINLLTTQSVFQAIIIISGVSALGLALGKVKIKGIALGVTIVFFVGIIAGHFGLKLDSNMLKFAEDFGLVIYIFSLGLQVGPGFIASLGKSSLRLNLLSIAIILLGSLLVVLMYNSSSYSLGELMGLFAGAVTNTPLLAAAQQTLNQLQLPQGNMAIATAVAYPMGVLGVIIGLIILKALFRKNKKILNISETDNNQTYIVAYEVTNPQLFNKTVQEIAQLIDSHFIVSRIWHKGKVAIPLSNSIIHPNDHLLIITHEEHSPQLRALFGIQEQEDWNKKDIDWNKIDSQLISSRILVTQSNLNGKTISSLRLRNQYGVNITRIHRTGIDLLPTPQFTLQIGDRLTLVGESNSIKKLTPLLGNKVKDLDSPNIITYFLGLMLGLVVGSIPFTFPGISVPIQLGLAGGPIIVGILISAFGPRIHMISYTTVSTNRMLRAIGLSMFLACLGLDSGAQFFEIVMTQSGLIWLGLGTILTMLPILIIGLIAMGIFKYDYATTAGTICGSMANPMALDYISNDLNSERPTVAYASVYPLGLFLRIILTQLTILLFI